jgi:AsmA family protein
MHRRLWCPFDIEHWRATLSTLNGRFDLMLRDGTLSHLATEAVGLDLVQGLGVIIRGDRPLPLRCERIQGHRAQRHRAHGPRRDRQRRQHVAPGGRVEPEGRVAGVVATSRPKDFSPLSLRTPITVRGTLAQPRIGVEGGRLVGKLGVAAALGAAVGPFAALIPLIDFGSKGVGDPCAAAPPTTPPSANVATVAASAPANR